MGSPPRMRGKETVRRPRKWFTGITPAYAGKRHVLRQVGVIVGDHPRVCGETRSRFSRPQDIKGSPPHMRGKGGFMKSSSRHRGITPAYAGKSHSLLPSIIFSGDHPRICGEKQAAVIRMTTPKGSPPHMRGKATAETVRDKCKGITPAYAGKRAISCRRTLSTLDHPRVCGEKRHQPVLV